MSTSAVVADADLTVRAGTAEGLLSGSGSRLSFETGDLSTFLASMPSRSNRGLSIVATSLVSMGLSIRVFENGREILEIGRVERSVLSRALGLRNVRIRRPVRLMVSYLRR